MKYIHPDVCAFVIIVKYQFLSQPALRSLTGMIGGLPVGAVLPKMLAPGGTCSPSRRPMRIVNHASTSRLLQKRQYSQPMHVSEVAVTHLSSVPVNIANAVNLCPWLQC